MILPICSLLSINLCASTIFSNGKVFAIIGFSTSLGICTPYVAQAKLIRRLIDDEGLGNSVEAGTVHLE
jgi:superfamily I DNA and/or RNA helicase